MTGKFYSNFKIRINKKGSQQQQQQNTLKVTSPQGYSQGSTFQFTIKVWLLYIQKL